MSKTFKKYPRGKLNAEDDGVVDVAISIEQDAVRIDFPHAVKWFAMPAELAEEFGQHLIDRAQEAKKHRQ